MLFNGGHRRGYAALLRLYALRGASVAVCVVEARV